MQKGTAFPPASKKKTSLTDKDGGDFIHGWTDFAQGKINMAK